MNPTSEFKGGKEKQGSMFKRYINLLLPQKKLFIYAIVSSVILTVLGIASSMFNKILMDEILPYGLKSLLVSMILVFSIVSITSTLISTVRQWILIHLSIKKMCIRDSCGPLLPYPHHCHLPCDLRKNDRGVFDRVRGADPVCHDGQPGMGPYGAELLEVPAGAGLSGFSY